MYEQDHLRWFAAFEPSMIKANLRTWALIAIWIALSGGLFYCFNVWLHPNTVEKLSQGKEVTLRRDASGHYRAEAFINGIRINVLVDTGATDVSISKKLASKLGIQSNLAIRTHTANGEVIAYRARLASVKIGGIEATNVAAIIAPDLGEDMLLGMSFLGRMDVRLNKGNMTIRAVSN